MPQGHHSDGSSIQRHSAGPIYPCVVQIHEVANPAGGWWRTFDLLLPDGSQETFGTYEAAWEHAAEIVRLKRLSASSAVGLVQELSQMVGLGAVTLADLVALACRLRDGELTARDRSRIDVLRGFNNLLKSFGNTPADATQDLASRRHLN